MSILFDCPECGKHLRLGEAFAGKTCKCPGCGTLIQVPEAEAAKAEAGALAEAVVASDGNEETPSKAGAADARPDAVGTSVSADDRLAERRARRRRRQQSSGAALWVVLSGVLVLLLAGGGFALYFFVFHKERFTQKEIALFPDEADQVDSINLDAIRSSGVYSTINEARPDFLKQIPVLKPFATWGFDLAQIRRVTRARVSGRPSEQVVVLHLREPMTAEQVAARLKDNGLASSPFGTSGMHLIGRGAIRNDVGNAFVVQGSMVVFGLDRTLEPALKREENPRLLGPMAEALADADVSAAFVEVRLTLFESPEHRQKSREPDFKVSTGRLGKATVEKIVKEHFKNEADAQAGRAKAQERLEQLKLDPTQKNSLEHAKLWTVSRSGAVVTTTVVLDPVEALDEFP